jgi:D-alanine-D-alanine ligase
VVSKELLARAGLPQVRFGAVTHAEWGSERERTLAGLADLGLPVFIKPAALGSSVGIARVAAAEELAPALDSALEHDPRAIVEANATGLEIECSVIGTTEPTASEPGEIVLTGAAPGGWYDYEAKYTPGGMELVVPARISATARARVRDLAVQTFAVLGCSGLARVDFFVDGEDVLVNELNTMPGFTETSVFGKLFAASGVPYEELLDRLAGFALERHAAEQEFRH